MPGIVGLITQVPRERAEAELRRMLQSITHEPFYRVGIWMDESIGVYVGWVFRKDSFADAMPLLDERGNTVLIFSGEEFTDAGRSTDCISGKRAPSYLLPNKQDQPTFPEKLNGFFHGVLVDRSQGIATLFNDRYGMHRLYCHEAVDAFYFAAEAKAILATCPRTRELDYQSVGEFISCGCVLQNRALFMGIRVLPPGSKWIFRNGRLDHKAVFFAADEWEKQTPLEPESYYEQLRDTFAQSLQRYFRGPQRTALSLTGGLDTRMILAWQKPEPRSLPCYTFGGEVRDCRDVTIARKVAHESGQTHEVIRVGSDFLSNFAGYAERTVYLSDGCSGVNRSADLYANERAREIAPVRMTGNYGDELLRNIRVFKPSEPVSGLYHAEAEREIRRARQTYMDSLAGRPLSFSLFRQAPWYSYGLLALEQTQLSVRTPYFDNDLVRTVYRAPASAASNNDLRVRLIRDGNSALGRIRTDLGFAGNPVFGAVSRKVQALSMKAEYAYDHGMPQWMASIDHRLAPLHLEQLFLGRHKFYHFRVWYRDALSKYVQEMLLDPRTLARPYLERKGVERIVQGHIKGNRNYTTEIHKVLTLELVHRLFVDARD